MHPLLDAIVGGWQTSHILFWSSGDLLGNVCWNANYCGYLNQMIAPAITPKVYRRRDHWFDASGFAIALPYTPRTNPWYYPGLYGPRNWNAFNHFLPTDPVTDITSPNFGKSTNQELRPADPVHGPSELLIWRTSGEARSSWIRG